MSLFIDLVAVAIFFAIIIISTKRGFIKTLMSFISKIVAFICAYTFAPLAASLYKENFLGSIGDSIAETVRSLLPDTEGIVDAASLFDKIPETLSSILERYNVDSQTVLDSLPSKTGTAEEITKSVSEAISSPIVDMIATALGFLTVFVLVWIVLAVLTGVIGVAFELPVLKQTNTVLGLILGILTAAIIIFVYANVVSALVVALGAVSPDTFGSRVIEETNLVRIVSDIDLMALVEKIK